MTATTPEQKQRHLEWQRGWRVRNKDKVREQSRRYHAKYRDRQLAKMKAWYRTNPDKVYRKYGYPAATRSRPLLCECCGRVSGKGILHLDHCHKTHTFRGWLCMGCNRGIGYLGDGIKGVELALAYLRKNS